MYKDFTPNDWIWIRRDDESKIWSSKVSAYIQERPTENFTYIENEQDLDSVLRQYNLTSPIIIADDIRKEASRRMQIAFNARNEEHLTILISNATREAIRLQNHRLHGDTLTQEQIVREQELIQADALIEHLRNCSNALEPNPPADYQDDKYWN